MSPTGTAIDGNMLIPLDGEIVSSADISPPEIGGEVICRNVRELSEYFGFEGSGCYVFPVSGDVEVCCEGHDKEQAQDRNFHKSID